MGTDTYGAVEVGVFGLFRVVPLYPDLARLEGHKPTGVRWEGLDGVAFETDDPFDGEAFGRGGGGPVGGASNASPRRGLRGEGGG